MAYCVGPPMGSIEALAGRVSSGGRSSLGSIDPLVGREGLICLDSPSLSQTALIPGNSALEAVKSLDFSKVSLNQVGFKIYVDLYDPCLENPSHINWLMSDLLEGRFSCGSLPKPLEYYSGFLKCCQSSELDRAFVRLLTPDIAFIDSAMRFHEFGSQLLDVYPGFNVNPGGITLESRSQILKNIELLWEVNGDRQGLSLISDPSYWFVYGKPKSFFRFV